MNSTRTQSQLCIATAISSFAQCHISFRLLPSSDIYQTFMQALLSTAIFSERLSFFNVYEVSRFRSPYHWNMHLWHTFWLQSISFPSLINTIYPVNIMVWWYCKENAKSRHPNWCITVINSTARLPCLWIIVVVLLSDMIVSVSHV